MKQYKISEQDLIALVNYLAQHPYNQVFKLIEFLHKLEEVK